jgi:hypothetical protein
MSRISQISRQYHAALATSQQQYESLYRERAAATQSFYQQFFRGLVCSFAERFEDERFRARAQEWIERATGARSLQFVAVDGTCQRESFADFITFFGAAYGAKGEVSFAGGTHRLTYKRWALDHDVSMVAWIPIPFARLEEVSQEQGEQFLVTEEERVNLTAVHVQIMQLAEVFLAYNTIRSSRIDAPQLLLLDLSPSSVLASVARSAERLGLVGYPYDRRALTQADITVALAHPFSDHFGIPSNKRMDSARVLLAELSRAPDRRVTVGEIAERRGLHEGRLNDSARYLVSRGVLSPVPGARPRYSPAMRVDESWAYTRDFFQNLCSRLFLDKDPGALQYDAPDGHGTLRRRWMSPDDLGFLIGVGMRLLIEECWQRNVLLYGVVKDSLSRYLTRNFLGVALEASFYPELRGIDVAVLPWTDRIFCETLPLIDEGLRAPWATVEFDSAFMTLHRERIEGSQDTRIAGVMGRIVNQERLFMRSLGQFFLRREKATPLMGHVVFLERLLSPAWDRFGWEGSPAEIIVDTPDLGSLSVLAWRNRDHANYGQQVMMYLLSVLTRNHFAEAVGYPDPLHKADWGAKTLGRSVAETIRSSTQLLAANPLSRTFRSIRDAGGR